MQYFLDVPEHMDKTFKKIGKKNKKQFSIINAKVRKILQNPHHFKPLRGDMHGARRVHIDKSFVLIYEIDEEKNVVRLLDYAHHDNIY